MLSVEQKRKDGIIRRSAEKLFIAKGYAATSMDEIAMESGFTKRTVYRYYASKSDLYQVLVHNAFLLQNQVVEEYITTHRPVSLFEQIRVLGEGVANFSLNNPGLFKLIIEYESIENDENYTSEYARLCRSESEKVILLMMEIVKEGISNGEIRNDIPVKSLVAYIASTTHGVLHYESRKGLYLQDDFNLQPGDLIKMHFERLLDLISNKR